jgi:hypothetical protein
VSPFHDPEEGFGSVSLGERGSLIWGSSLLVNASQREEHCGREGHRRLIRVVGLVGEGCGGSAGQVFRQSFEEFDIDFARSLGFGRDVNGVKFGGSHKSWGFGGVRGSRGARIGVGFVGVGDRSRGFGRGVGVSAGNGFGSSSAVGTGFTSGGSATFLMFFGGGEETSRLCLLLSRSIKLGSGSSTASSSASSNSSSSSMSSIFSSLSLLRNLGTKEGLTTLTHSMEPSEELESKLRLELELLELDTEEGELGLGFLLEKRISSSPWDMSFNLVGILSWKQGRTKEV